MRKASFIFIPITLAFVIGWFLFGALVMPSNAAAGTPLEKTPVPIIDLQTKLSPARNPEAAPKLTPIEKESPLQIMPASAALRSPQLQAGNAAPSRVGDGDISFYMGVFTEFTDCQNAEQTITVPEGQNVMYCYMFTNNTTSTVYQFHTITDTVFGILADEVHFPVAPGDSVYLVTGDFPVTTTTHIGTWTATTSDGIVASDTASVTVIISGSLPTAPTPQIYPMALQSVQEPDTQVERVISISNFGNGSYEWTVADCGTASWLSVEPNAGIVTPYDTQYMTVTFDSTGLVTGTTDTTDLCLTTNDPVEPNVTIPASLEIGESGFFLEVTVGTELDECATTTEITVPAGQRVTFCYTLTNNTPYLLSEHEVGDDVVGPPYPFYYPLPPGTSQSLYITVPATEDDLVNVTTWTAKDGSHTVTYQAVATSTLIVSGTVPQIPNVSVQPEELQATLPSNAQLGRYLFISNDGYADLEWAYTDCDTASWVSIDHQVGTVPVGYTDYPIVTLNSSGLVTGTYNTDLCLNTNDPDALTVTIPITLNVANFAGFNVDVTVGTDPYTCPTTKAITVTYGQEIGYCYTIENNTEFILNDHNVTDSFLGYLGSVHYPVYPGDIVEFYLPFYPSESMQNDVTWTAQDSDGNVLVDTDTVFVNVIVPTEPIIGVNPGEVERNLLPNTSSPVNLAIQNIGGGTLNWVLADCSGTTPDWLTLDTTSGSLGIFESENVFFNLDATGLLTDTYNTSLCFTSNDVNTPTFTVPVTVNVVDEGAGGLVFELTVGVDDYSCGDQTTISVPLYSNIFYCYHIENNGSNTFMMHDVLDSYWGLIGDQFYFPIAPGEQFDFLYSVIASENMTNTVIWTAYDEFGVASPAVDSVQVTIGDPDEGANVRLDVTVGLAGGDCAGTDSLLADIPDEGLAVTYCYTVVNDGTAKLDLHDLHDSEHGMIFANVSHTFYPGETFVFTHTATITSPMSSIATWHAYRPDGPLATATDTVVIEQLPEVVYELFLPALRK